jgi:ribosomal protein S18 acetylase RimI-like enzyme
MRAAFAEYAGKLAQPSGALRESAEDVKRAMASGGAVLAFIGDAAVGSARFLPEPEALYVGRVAVLPEYRRRGVASVVMRFFEEHARSQGKAAVRIGVRESLPSNLALYESLGYQRVKSEPHGADRSWTMIKRLSDR